MYISLYQHQWAQWALVCISMYCMCGIGDIIFNGIDVYNRWSRYFLPSPKFFVMACLLPNILFWLYLLIVSGNFGIEEVYVPMEIMGQTQVESLNESEKMVEKFMSYVEKESKVPIFSCGIIIYTCRWVSMNKFMLYENKHLLYERVSSFAVRQQYILAF